MRVVAGERLHGAARHGTEHRPPRTPGAPLTDGRRIGRPPARPPGDHHTGVCIALLTAVRRRGTAVRRPEAYAWPGFGSDATRGRRPASDDEAGRWRGNRPKACRCRLRRRHVALLTKGEAMNGIIRGGLAVALFAVLIACEERSPEAEQTAAPSAAATSQGAAPNPERNAYFGELHLHTSWSFDAYCLSEHRGRSRCRVSLRQGRGHPPHERRDGQAQYPARLRRRDRPRRVPGRGATAHGRQSPAVSEAGGGQVPQQGPQGGYGGLSRAGRRDRGSAQARRRSDRSEDRRTDLEARPGVRRTAQRAGQVHHLHRVRVELDARQQPTCIAT